MKANIKHLRQGPICSTTIEVEDATGQEIADLLNGLPGVVAVKEELIQQRNREIDDVILKNATFGPVLNR